MLTRLVVTILGAMVMVLFAEPMPPTSASSTAALARQKVIVHGGTGWDVTRGAAVLPGGSFYVVGYTSSILFDGYATQGDDPFVVKFAKGGKRLWSRLLRGAESDTGEAVAAAPNGSVFVAGHTASPTFLGVENPTGHAAFLVKLTKTGRTEWVRLLAGDGREDPTGVAIAKNGDIFVTGETSSTSLAGQRTFGDDFFLARYDASGKLRRVTIRGASNRLDRSTGVAIDTDGSVYVSSFSTAPDDGATLGSNGSLVELTKFDRLGNFAWVRRINGKGDEQSGRIAARNGRIYLVGTTDSPKLAGQPTRGNADGFIMRYAPDGKRAWTRIWGEAAAFELATGVAIARNGDVLVTGVSSPPPNYSPDLITLSFSPGGHEQATAIVSGSDADQGVEVLPLRDGTFWVAGMTLSPRVHGKVNRGFADILLARFRVE